MDTQNADTWLVKAESATSYDERLLYLSKASQLAPDDPEINKAMQLALRQALDRDPYLAYKNETDHLYFVEKKENNYLVVPKGRAVPEKYPPSKPSTLAPAYRLLAWAIVGLPLAGIGTLIFAPLAIRSLLRLREKPLEQSDRVRANLILTISTLLIFPALLLGWLFLLHLIG